MKIRIALLCLCAMNCFLFGQTPKPPTAAELKTFQETKVKAEKGDAAAQNKLALIYIEGAGVASDIVEAVKWFRKAAEQGDAIGQNALGSVYEDGRGVARDHKEAAKWYRKAAEQGQANAQGNLGALYANGQGVPKDEVEAFKWGLLAAAQGVELSRNSVELGAKRLTGAQRAQGLQRAFKWKPQIPKKAP